MKSFLIALLSLSIVGCASTEANLPTYQIPANLIAPCQELPRLRAGSLADLYKYTIEIATLYNQCAIRHDALSEAVKKSK